MRIAVTGANGFVGRTLVRELAAKGHQVLGYVRQPGDFAHVDGVITVAAPELGLNENWQFRAELGIDVLVHVAARVHVMQDSSADPQKEFRKVNAEGTVNLARQAAQAGVKRFVFLSSIKVNGELTKDGQPLAADDVPAPEDPYGISKYEAELLLRQIATETGMEAVIIRPPLVYGPGVKGNFASLVRWVRKGMPLPLGAVHNRRSLVALENLVDFIALCSDPERSPRAANEVFLISDGEDVSTTELLRKVANAYNVAPRLLPIPVSWIQTATRLLGKSAVANRLVGSLVVDSSKARDLLGWKPVVSMDEQLKKMAFHDARI